MNKKELIEFEDDIKKKYEQGKIKSPVHFSGGNEKQLIKIFKKIKPEDWIFSTHRSHYHSLLKSKNSKWLKTQILLNRSMHINSKKYKIFTSSIVGGHIPIAVGMALAIKATEGKERVWCFLGDMASEMGIFWECFKYASNFELPIIFVVEDNKIGCYTPTDIVWGKRNHIYNDQIKEYKYERTYPHHGIGKWINF